jgi:hypothetical protein
VYSVDVKVPLPNAWHQTNVWSRPFFPEKLYEITQL